MARKIITLTTDYGLKDSYVAQMKGVICSINPDAHVIDISHEVAGHDLLEAAFLIGSAFQYFPKRTIHVVIVDPGVGTKRKPLLVSTEGYYLIGPDNGVFSFVYLADRVTQVFELTATHYFRTEISQTFHGRDIFAPCAAWLSKGQNAVDFGEPLQNYTKLSIPKPSLAGKAVKGLVLHIDRFGNLITNIALKDLYALMKKAGAQRIKAVIQGKEIPGLA
ncbi:S-adenosyl-l-methionine hydroxide adenosyltransferase family protein, partial [Acidobacteriota bacterium]